MSITAIEAAQSARQPYSATTTRAGGLQPVWPWLLPLPSLPYPTRTPAVPDVRKAYLTVYCNDLGHMLTAGPRYGKEVVGRRVRIFAANGSWRDGTIKAYHGGYYRHTGVFEHV